MITTRMYIYQNSTFNFLEKLASDIIAMSVLIANNSDYCVICTNLTMSALLKRSCFKICLTKKKSKKKECMPELVTSVSSVEKESNYVSFEKHLDSSCGSLWVAPLIHDSFLLILSSDWKCTTRQLLPGFGAIIPGLFPALILSIWGQVGP